MYGTREERLQGECEHMCVCQGGAWTWWMAEMMWGYPDIETSMEILVFAVREQTGIRVSAAGLCLASTSPATQHRWDKYRQGQPAMHFAGLTEAVHSGGHCQLISKGEAF